VVTTVSGRQWSGAARLDEVVRIGQLNGPEEYTFADVLAVAARGAGPVYVYDRRLFVLRMYDATGTYIRTIGRLGSGPGEYRYILGLAMLADGRLAAWDVRGQRVNVYTAGGEPQHDRVIGGARQLFTDNTFAIDAEDRFLILTSIGGVYATLVVDTAGRTLDTLRYPRPQRLTTPGMTGVHPRYHVAVHPEGYFVWGESDRYEIRLRNTHGTPMVIGRQIDPLVWEAEERAQIAAQLRWAAESGRGTRPPPDLAKTTKPYFIEIKVNRDGSIWLLRQTHSRRRTAPLTPSASGMPQVAWEDGHEFDVFAPTGEYMGAVPVPPRATVEVLDGRDVWAVVRDDDDVPYIVRYKLVVGA
jgi:hypothetical protein